MAIKINVNAQYKYTSPAIRPFEIMEYFKLHIKSKLSIKKQTESYKDSENTTPPADRIYIWSTKKDYAKLKKSL